MIKTYRTSGRAIDRRKNYILILDVETSGNLTANDSSIVYDLGGSIIDTTGGTHEEFSFLIEEIFMPYDEGKSYMQSAYYGWKLPYYTRKAQNGEISIVSFWDARKHIHDLIKRYNIKIAMAHNARFDSKALNNTIRYLTASKERNFLPYGVEWWCTMTMAQHTLKTDKRYSAWCDEKPQTRRTEKRGWVKLTAEVLYQYISGDDNFVEEHTGLADVRIEKKIFWYIKNNYNFSEVYKSPWGMKFEDKQKRLKKHKIKPHRNTRFQWDIYQIAKSQKSLV